MAGLDKAGSPIPGMSSEHSYQAKAREASADFLKSCLLLTVREPS